MHGGFVISDIVFGCDKSICNPSSVWILGMLTEISSLTALWLLV